MRLSIATKVFVAFAALCATFAAVLMFGVFRTQTAHRQFEVINNKIIPLSMLLADVHFELKGIHALSDRQSTPARESASVMRFPNQFDIKLQQAVHLSDGSVYANLAGPERPRLQKIHQRLRALADRGRSLAKKMRRLSQDHAQTMPSTVKPWPVNPAKLASRTLTANKPGHVGAEARHLDRDLRALRNDLRVVSDLTLNRIHSSERTNLYLLIVTTALAMVVALGLFGFVFWTLRPLGLFTNAVKRIAEGDYRPSSVIARYERGGDEIALLSREFNAMAITLAERDSALKRQHAALVQSERLAAIGRMTSLITHELRNPLSSIGLNAEEVYETLLDDQTSSDALLLPLETIIQEVDRLRDITEEYLVYARLPAPQCERENVVDIAQNLLDFHVWEWANAGVDVRLQTSSPEIWGWVDAQQLRQALLNLIKNAVEASKPQQTVDVAIHEEYECIVLRVTDRGSGILPEDREHIFEPFFSTKGTGTGLGLSMTAQILEDHRAQLAVESSCDLGTTFTIELPRAKDEPSDELGSQRPSTYQPGDFA